MAVQPRPQTAIRLGGGLALAVEQQPRISAANYLEIAIVVDAGRDPIASRYVDDLVTKARLVIEPVTVGTGATEQREGA